MAAVVLAGGFGTRLRGVLPDLPKPMAPAAGRPFVEWIVHFLGRQGVENVALSTGYKAEVIENHFTRQPVSNVCVRCAEEIEPLGTAGGFLNAVGLSSFSSEAWLVVNGDSLVVAELDGLWEVLRDAGVDGAVLSLWVDDASRYGSLDIDEQGMLAGFREKRPGAAWINAGVYLFRASLLDLFPATRPLSFETDVFPALIGAGRKIAVVKTSGAFLDIGLPETFAQAEDFIRENASSF